MLLTISNPVTKRPSLIKLTFFFFFDLLKGFYNCLEGLDSIFYCATIYGKNLLVYPLPTRQSLPTRNSGNFRETWKKEQLYLLFWLFVLFVLYDNDISD